MSLRELIREEIAASMSEEELLEGARSARLYFQRPDTPGFLVSETDEGPVVPVFTSWEGLGLFAGVCAWASTTAEDLVGLLREGVRAVVNPLDTGAFVLDAEALRMPRSEDGAE